MMGPAFSQLDLEVVEARHRELTREYQRSQPARTAHEGGSRLRAAIRAVTARI